MATTWRKLLEPLLEKNDENLDEVVFDGGGGHTTKTQVPTLTLAVMFMDIAGFHTDSHISNQP